MRRGDSQLKRLKSCGEMYVNRILVSRYLQRQAVGDGDHVSQQREPRHIRRGAGSEAQSNVTGVVEQLGGKLR